MEEKEKEYQKKVKEFHMERIKELLIKGCHPKDSKFYRWNVYRGILNECIDVCIR